MDRRSFLRSSALVGSAAAGLAAPAYAQDKRTLTMVTTWGRDLVGVHDSAQHVADRITEMSGGNLTVEVVAAGERFDAYEVFDAVTSGSADMYHGADYYFTDKHPAYAFFTAVPFGLTAQEMLNWYYFDGGMELHDQLGEIFGLKSFLAGNTGAQAGGWFRTPIDSPEGFDGLRFRMPGLGGEALGRLGANVLSIPGAGVFEALSSGAIDGTEWIGPWADEKAGFHKIAKHYYTSGFHEPGAGLSLAMNRAVFTSLTPAQRAIVKSAALEAHQWTLSRFLSQNGAALQRLRAAGVQLNEFPPSVWDAFARVSTETLDQYMSDRLFAEIRNSVTESVRKSSGWIQRSEGAYRTQRDRVFG
ncbi:TRAP-type mannitol/chloroaromatic compound transport system, substrate-binding protein [Palleronia marisminoris]|uniref:Monocarboxylate 2-oxoacid-binding periplasmic protein n=1 Tax=Palleronia marisminoris TaxID=315423 RepID=A0A1Y5TBA5_9RHOB|nr:ABC transporter substrate-binding protein [Palleronia marisminoris]SFH22627.1 TRAP-type mannitol/chloroaromatic compound transport system, substrate-binding protein [Palleronia marisminoris]SLN57962.1 Monocarboxylate 2-oxoacid-binding periplasmic protein precursor [Palleronia marisminoris]